MLPQRFLCSLRSSPLWCTRIKFTVPDSLEYPGYLVESVDIGWYARRYRELLLGAVTPADCAIHCFQNARKYQLNPNLAFDEAWYCRQYPEAARMVQDGTFLSGWDHYLGQGAAEQKNPNFWFDERWYQKRYPDAHDAVKHKSLWCGFEHYLLYGIYQDWSPSFYFDAAWYRQRYFGDSAENGSRRFPVVHFLKASVRPPAIPAFDENWYRRSYMEEPAAVSGTAATLPLSPWEHYLRFGRDRGYSPSPNFNEAAYRVAYPQIAEKIAQGICSSGLEHYLTEGALSGLAAATHLNTGGADYSCPQYLGGYEQSLRLNFKQLSLLRTLLEQSR